MKLLSGTKVSKEIAEKLKQEVSAFDIKPVLTIVQVGTNPASTKYVSMKIKKAQSIGIDAKVINLDESITQQELEVEVKKATADSTGVIVQLPLPNHINKQEILDLIPYEKDVDGLATGNNLITPATPKGIMTLLEYYNYSVKGMNVAVVGQSKLVGKPVADLCEAAGAKEVQRFTRQTGIAGTENADILIVAAGEAGLIKKENIKPGVVIVDVGINSIADENAMKKIVGDVDRESIGEIPGAISPVPGGVGPMTVISLMMNVVEAKNRN